MFPIDLSITRIKKHTSQVWSFFMIPQQAPRPEFIAGQVAVFEMGNHHSAYVAFASAPEDEEFEFLIKRGAATNVTGRLFDPHSTKHVMLRNIIGHGFAVDAHRGSDLVLIAMGTGLAPLRSALRHIFYHRAEFGRLVVLYGARTVEDFCFEDEMMTEWKRHGVELRQVISQPTAEWSGPTGYVQGLLDHIVPDLRRPVALVCGSNEMIAQTSGRLVTLGFAREAILTNY
jgi:NAD(P)H-flavin reductase